MQHVTVFNEVQNLVLNFRCSPFSFEMFQLWGSKSIPFYRKRERLARSRYLLQVTVLRSCRKPPPPCCVKFSYNASCPIGLQARQYTDLSLGAEVHSEVFELLLSLSRVKTWIQISKRDVWRKMLFVNRGSLVQWGGFRSQIKRCRCLNSKAPWDHL